MYTWTDKANLKVYDSQTEFHENAAHQAKDLKWNTNQKITNLARTYPLVNMHYGFQPLSNSPSQISDTLPVN